MCGSGELLASTFCRFADNGNHRFLGFDISENMLALAPDLLKNNSCFTLKKGDVNNINLASESVDIVLIRGGLHHVHTTLDTVLSEIYRVLKPGGAFIYFEPSDENIIIEFARQVLYKKHSFFVEDEEKGMKTKPLLAALKQAGFKQNKISPFGYLAYTTIGNTDVFPLFSRLKQMEIIKFLIGLDDVMEKVPVLSRMNLACLGVSSK